MPDWVIAPTARIHSDAIIGPRTRIGDFCVVEQDVVIGADCLLEPYVYVKRWTTLGDGNEISAGTVLGSDPLDKNFKGDRSYLRIGNNNKIREHYTISRGTKPETVTTIGDGNYIMTSGHIAHNCVIGNDNTIASATMVAGHTEIENQVFISGGVLIHQYSRIGRLAMISGNSRVNLDTPPFFTYTDRGEYVEPRGLNIVGMKRAGFSAEQISRIKQVYRVLYRSGLKLDEALGKIESELADENTLHLVRFIRGSQRGICRELTPRVRSHAAAVRAGVEDHRDDQD